MNFKWIKKIDAFTIIGLIASIGTLVQVTCFFYAKENKYIDELFYDRNAHKYSDKYHKYLNF